MENYQLSQSIEELLDKSKINVPNLPPDFLWMQVRGGTKIRNVLQHALSNFNEENVIVWTGFGPSVGKAITCAEIMKRKLGHTLHQITKICYRKTEEIWDSLIPGMDQIIVKRQAPMIHIILSKAPLSTKERGYQPPGMQIRYNYKNGTATQKQKSRKTPTKEFANMGLKMNKRQ